MSETAISEELAAIDTSVLDELTRLKQEVETLDDRLKAMEEKKESVAQAVYQRVKGDYESKRKQLDKDAAPLKDKARQEYAKLFALLSRSEADHEAATLDREEVEFRHTLGEFDQEEFDRRIAEIDQRVQAKADVREQAQGLRERFVAAFRSEEELNSKVAAGNKAEPATPLSNPTVDPASTQPPPAQTPSEEATVQLKTLKPEQLADPNATIPPPPSAPTPPPAPAIPAAGDPGATQAMRVLKGSNGGVTPPRADQTVIIRGARLVPQNPEAGKLTHTVGLKPVSIGSGEDCDVRVAGAASKHAEIRVSMAGYTVSDLGGGVRINGVVVEQHLMRHDDVLEIGPARFTFREG
ncbi:FHA domain-containing protein [Pseudomarimonas arenosa]|uniref:FHA domain-containing protein n=1 Tax=Pseudomarimonas arenosa TaxID=2774145 RepID=A0AAW3ZGD8_9GAMM|nr:FHA domain-containing protein [Pseudomarimonas arenosa]MBD8525183.1 FHA domain-containing protein [Pseudomarimonas arenosa]